MKLLSILTVVSVLSFTNCKSKKEDSDTKVVQEEGSSVSLVGSWKNSDCQKHESEGTQKLWYTETIIFTESTMESLNRYFTDAECTDLDSYQPTGTEESYKTRYKLGKKISSLENTYEIDFSFPKNLDVPNIYSIISIDQKIIRFGGGNATQRGKTPATRVNDLGKRSFTKVAQ